jgi:hypothetical protein
MWKKEMNVSWENKIKIRGGRLSNQRKGMKRINVRKKLMNS